MVNVPTCNSLTNHQGFANPTLGNPDAQYNPMTDFETEYVFCKDNRLVLIVECLFAKASTANTVAELLKLRPFLREQQLICIKATYSNSECFGSYPKSGNFMPLFIASTSYKIFIWSKIL